MRARTVGINATIPVVVAVEVAVAAAIVIFPPARMSWWPTAATAVVAILLLMVTAYRRNVVTWVADRVRLRRRRRRAESPAPAIDIPHGASLYGVRVPDRFDGEAITMVEVTGQAYSPTLLTGSATALTPNRLPLEALTGLLDQPGGIRLSGVDVVSSGLRVRRGIGYPPLYSTLLADRPAAGQRRTYLVVRLDVASSVSGLAYRSTVGAAAAAATERIVNALLQRGVRAKPLTAKDLDAALVELGAGLAVVPAEAEPDNAPVGTRIPTPVAPTETWKSIEAHPGYLTSYYFSPEDITTNTLNQMWALRSDAVVQTISLTKKRGPTDGPHLGVGAGAGQRSAGRRRGRPRCTSTRCPAIRAPPRNGRPRCTRRFDAVPARPLDATRARAAGRFIRRACRHHPARRSVAAVADRSGSGHPHRIAHRYAVRLPATGTRGGGRRAHRDLHRQARQVAPARAAVDRGCRSQAPAGVRSVDHRQRPGRWTTARRSGVVGDHDR